LRATLFAVDLDYARRHQMSTNEKAPKPEDLTRLFVERANAGDAAGLAELYEQQAVMAYPPGGRTVGREAIRALMEKMLEKAPEFKPESPLPTLISGDIALTSTVALDGTLSGLSPSDGYANIRS
jgi:ketosteroid isomerase-like protein